MKKYLEWALAQVPEEQHEKMMGALLLFTFLTEDKNKHLPTAMKKLVEMLNNPPNFELWKNRN
jgi:hypothetical protein